MPNIKLIYIKWLRVGKFSESLRKNVASWDSFHADTKGCCFSIFRKEKMRFGNDFLGIDLGFAK